MGESPRRSKYSESPSPRRRYSRSRSPVRRYGSRSPGRRDNGSRAEASNPGNNLYVTGLSTRVTEKDLEEHFSREGKVTECRLVVDPRTRESRGFGFVTMEAVGDADRCIKYLNRSTLEGRIITVEKRIRCQGPPLQHRGPNFSFCTGSQSGEGQEHQLLVLTLVCELPYEVIREAMDVTMIEITTVQGGLLDIHRTVVAENAIGTVSALPATQAGGAMGEIDLVLLSTHHTKGDGCFSCKSLYLMFQKRLDLAFGKLNFADLTPRLGN